jgi:hypothetical protein
MIKKLLRKTAVKIIRNSGYSAYTAPKLLDSFVNDFFNIKDISFRDKLWAYQRGFFSEQIRRYNLNETNRRDYLSDFDYLKLQPINSSSRCIDDKLTMRYVFNEFAEFMPKYFYFVSDGKVRSLIDICDKGNVGINNIFIYWKKRKILL